MKTANTLVILDAHALIHRAYHALPSFTSQSGEPMGAVYGVSAVLIKLIRELKPTHIAAAFDREEKTFRHIAYEKYKGTREKTKDDLVPQFSKTKDVFKAFDIPMYEVAGFEADDIIGTIVEKFKKEKNLSIIIASGDMDTMQLVDNKRVQVYTLRKGIEDTILYDEAKVQERYGFGPEHIIDFKGLKGDPSDNIIGVKGIGEKTATQLINHYGSVEELYKKLKKEKTHPSWLKERIKNLLLENEEEALFSKELATIRRDAPVDLVIDDLAYPGVPYEKALALFREFHFPSLANRLSAQAPGKEKEVAEKDSGVLDEKAFSEIKKAKELALYTHEGHGYIGVGEKEYMLEEKSLKAIQEILDDKRNIVADDAKALYHALSFQFPLQHDLKLASFVCDSEVRSFEPGEVLGNERIGAGMRELAQKLEARMKKEKLERVYHDFELPLIPVLYTMERTGIVVDADMIRAQEKEIARDISVLEKKIWKAAGKEFDINSPKQLSQILFEDLALSPKGIKKTSTKSISTQASELQKLLGMHPIIDMLLEFREITKLYSTYIKALPGLIANDGRIHTTYNQAGAATGRLSSNNPNLQNIPIRTKRGREVRKVFVAPPGFELVSCDYSQIELRLAAALSGDKKMLETFQKGEDIHTRTAAEVFHVSPGDVTPNMRRNAKAINFGILYGMGARALAASIKVSVAEADAYLEAYFKEFRGVAAYRQKTIEEGRMKGYVETPFGRKRYLPNLRSSFDFVRKEAERMAVNAPLQGTAADLIKRAMIKIHDELKLGEKNTDVKMLLQVHDELLFEIKKEKMASVIPTIKAIMEETPEFDVPIVVDVKHGKNWDDMKTYDRV